MRIQSKLETTTNNRQGASQGGGKSCAYFKRQQQAGAGTLNTVPTRLSPSRLVHRVPLTKAETASSIIITRMHINKVTPALIASAAELTINSSSNDQSMQPPTMMPATGRQTIQLQPSAAAAITVANLSDDPFDGSTEPIVFMSDNRMPVMIELSSAIIYIIFAALLLALVSILPGVRRKKMTSFVGLSTLLVAGASIILALDGSYWLRGALQIYEAPYGALTSETITGKLEVNVGLSSTNVTLYGRLMGVTDENRTQGHQQRDQVVQNSTTTTTTKEDKRKFVDYNERFHWDRPDRMSAEHEQALRRGLPYPILTITEFLSQDSDGFNWMRQLRQAGYFTSLALYAALASWCLTAVVMCVLPVYLPHMMQVTGALMMSSVWIYTLLIDSPKSIVIRLGETPMEFEFGHTYVITFMAGALSMFSGVMMFILLMNKPHDQVTIMDCDDYVKNHKALYGNSPAANLIVSEKDFVKTAYPSSDTRSSATMETRSNVIIPIGDIEEKFAQKTNLRG